MMKQEIGMYDDLTSFLGSALCTHLPVQSVNRNSLHNHGALRMGSINQYPAERVKQNLSESITLRV
jgi:hypothetical protein